METNLTKEWSEFDGGYEKKMQDIKLADGTIINGCWPNAGKFICCTNNKQKDIPVSQVFYVRLTHHKIGLDANGE